MLILSSSRISCLALKLVGFPPSMLPRWGFNQHIVKLLLVVKVMKLVPARVYA